MRLREDEEEEIPNDGLAYLYKYSKLYDHNVIFLQTTTMLGYLYIQLCICLFLQI